MFVYNPENFVPTDVLPPELHKFADHARYLLYKIIEGHIFNKINKKEYIPLKREYLIQIISKRKCTKIINCLKNSGCIEIDGYYIKGKKSYGYKLGPAYAKVKHKQIRLHDEKLIQRIKQFRTKKETEVKLDVYKHLQKNLQSISIDHQAALRTISQNDLSNWETSINMLNNKNWFFRTDDYGRVHTNITNLPTIVRQFLRHNNEKLTEIDITNSQPFFLGIISLNYYTYNKYCINLNTLPSPPLPNEGTFPKDLVKYIRLIREGSFYEYLVENSNLYCSRKKLKQSIFTNLLFGKNRFMKSSPVCNLFQDKFPSVYNVILDIKQRDFTQLSKCLTRAESSFIINRFIRTCMNKHPDVFVTTIHDCVLTTQTNRELIKNLLLQEFKDINLVPKLKIKNY